MQVCLFIEPHRGASYGDQLAFARHAEECGFFALFRADHYQSFGRGNPPGPTDAWVTLGALAQETARLRLGTLMTSATFRQPGPLAITVAQVDHMSGGRVEFGIGAGWYEREHTSYGIAFPSTAERFERLTEQLEIITGLWATPVDQTFTYKGRYYTLADSPALPKPVQRPGPPVIIGGRGLRRTPELAARYANEYNATFMGPEEARRRFEAVKQECERQGRRGTPLRLSGGVPVACGRTEAEARRRAQQLYEVDGVQPPGEAAVVGPPELLVERIGQLRAAGAERVYLRICDLHDLDHLDLIAAEVLPKITT
ncbi:MAG: LLM class F420-dependent oxidoreductase [Micromonosporaceae bacterium]